MREFQLETTMRHHFIPSRMAIIRQTIISVGRNTEKLDPSYTGGNENWCSGFENSQARSSKGSRESARDPAIPPLGTYT